MMDTIIALDSRFRGVQYLYKSHFIMTRRNGIMNLFFLWTNGQGQCQ